MKNYFTSAVMLLLFIAAGCSKDDTPHVTPVALSVQLSYDEDQSGLDLPLGNIEISATNATNGQTYTANTDVDGLAVFESLSPGVYKISASKTYSAADYTDISLTLT